MPSVNRRDAPPFTCPDGSSIREFLNPRNSVVRNQSLAEATLSPGQGTTRHLHPQAEEIYFILSGQGQMHIENEEFEVGQGDAIPIPAGQKHTIRNTSQTENLQFLCCCAPAYSDEDTILCE